MQPSEIPSDQLLSRLIDLDSKIVYFPVRHHSPLCAAMVRNAIEEIRPEAILIEGPSDFNENLDELFLEHELPIAIYSYFRFADSMGSGAYYPFSEFSPEWVAIREAKTRGIDVAWIDLPWVESAHLDRTTHRYADRELRHGEHVELLCQRLQVDDFDELWDRIAESDWNIDLSTFLKRVHSLCMNIRFSKSGISQSDFQRERFMGEQIARKNAECQGRILVITGGYHCSALMARVEDFPWEEEVIDSGSEDSARSLPETSSDLPSRTEHSPSTPIIRGIALTTYSYERLDRLTGYDAGMPNPGFYEWAWECRKQGQPFSHHPLLKKMAYELRKRKQTISTADLIAIETASRSLANLRGRNHVWRSDLVDAVLMGTVKDELQYDCQSPFLDAIHSVLRGDRRGKLAKGTRLPPLVLEIQQRMVELGVEFSKKGESFRLELHAETGIKKSRFLHALRILGIAGVDLIDGTDFIGRSKMDELWETWRLRWSPDFESSLIEGSRYGTNLWDATTSRLMDSTLSLSLDAGFAALILFESCRAGLPQLTQKMIDRLMELIDQETDFIVATSALSHLAYLHLHDEVFEAQQHFPLESLLSRCLERSFWLLELLGATLANEKRTIDGCLYLQEVLLNVQAIDTQRRFDFAKQLQRVLVDENKAPSLRGAAAGFLWNLGEADSTIVLRQLIGFPHPNDTGDFLTGLFALAREIAQRHPALVRAIDELLASYSGESFQHALPSLRLAFTYFTPREKHNLLKTLFDDLGINATQPLPRLTVSPELAAEALSIEEKIFTDLKRYGLEIRDGI